MTAADLEVLLLVHRERTGWTPAAIAKHLRIDPDQAKLILFRLSRGGLTKQNRDKYEYSPHDVVLADAVDALAEVYPAYRVAIISLIFADPGYSMRDFSEAFRLRDEE